VLVFLLRACRFGRRQVTAYPKEDTVIGRIVISGNKGRLAFTPNARFSAQQFSSQGGNMKPRVSDWIEVRSKEEILATLDKRGRMEGLPFMPQMFEYCGQRFKVYKRAHKTCDWVYTTRSRWLPNGIHLDLRCDGESYGGCKTGCLIYWKEAWLRPVKDSNESTVSSQQSPNSFPGPFNHTESSTCAEEDVLAGTHVEDGAEISEQKYTCQGTDVPSFTKPISWWDVRHYLQDYTSGNVTIGRMVRGFIYAVYFKLIKAGIGLGSPLRWIYDRFQGLWGGIPYPRKSGTIPAGQPTPKSDLNLRPGDLVRVKSYEEILTTLDRNCKNRGLNFDAEMVPYCGGTYRIRTILDKFIDEKTGKVVTMKKPCIILEGVWCQSRYSQCRMFCPRSLYSWWHDIWLERVEEVA